ncbi:hypothetical protein DM860_008061 [Cuscuta australis]|uniref:Uncharacterized protein n=1 Tax=Cuscuta australis TaxID=267555 RepID=A0A328D6I1_9ASTE|nr:hypothetical protein DM860_008061 [Cuscuta australis]
MVLAWFGAVLLDFSAMHFLAAGQAFTAGLWQPEFGIYLVGAVHLGMTVLWRSILMIGFEELLVMIFGPFLWHITLLLHHTTNFCNPVAANPPSAPCLRQPPFVAIPHHNHQFQHHCQPHHLCHSTSVVTARRLPSIASVPYHNHQPYHRCQSHHLRQNSVTAGPPTLLALSPSSPISMIADLFRSRRKMEKDDEEEEVKSTQRERRKKKRKKMGRWEEKEKREERVRIRERMKIRRERCG